MISIDRVSKQGPRYDDKGHGCYFSVSCYLQQELNRVLKVQVVCNNKSYQHNSLSYCH